MSFTTVAHCGNDHAAWLKSIDFYKEEFALMDKRLLEIASKNTGGAIMLQVEHFQNQFIVQRNNLDELKHLVHEHESSVLQDAKDHLGRMNTSNIGQHNQVKDAFDGTEKVIKDLRQEFNQFLSKWM